MCSSIIMENYQGDLTDIVRAGAYGVAINSSSQLLPASSSSSSSSASTISSTISHGHEHHHHHHHHLHSNDLSWHHQQQQHLSSSDPIMNFSSAVLEASTTSFGDPFSTIIRDPFLHLPNSASSPYFSSPSGGLEEAAAAGFVATSGNINASSTSGGSGTSCVFGGHSNNNNNNITVEEHNNNDMRRPCKNIFSNMIQISPNAKVAYDSQPMAPSPRPIKPSSLLSPSKDSLLHTSALQISSPRNPPLKRRKNQAKKVVCIPAPAAANSRQTGEVVPSDLWAWRKYGQKPIKGSPYPRGYYRCSSSKGCSARKQVERSRTDPNMLVITYTSEHNHPWPTQRNALAGSTRSQPSKGGNNNNTGSNSKNSSESNQKGTAKAKEEEQQEMSNNTSEGNDVSPVANNSVKEESMFEIEMDEGEFSDGMPYKPSCLMDQSNDNQSAEDFFAELGEIEADPLNLLFTQGFGAASASDDHQRESKALDPFHLFDWSGDTNNNITNNSFDEPNKRRL